jgi:hypothetical protein
MPAPEVAVFNRIPNIPEYPYLRKYPSHSSPANRFNRTLASDRILKAAQLSTHGDFP